MVLVKQLGKVTVAGFQLVNGFLGLGKLVQQIMLFDGHSWCSPGFCWCLNSLYAYGLRALLINVNPMAINRKVRLATAFFANTGPEPVSYLQVLLFGDKHPLPFIIEVVEGGDTFHMLQARLKLTAGL